MTPFLGFRSPINNDGACAASGVYIELHHVFRTLKSRFQRASLLQCCVACRCSSCCSRSTCAMLDAMECDFVQCVGVQCCSRCCIGLLEVLLELLEVLLELLEVLLELLEVLQ